MAREKQPKHVAVGQIYKLGNTGRIIMVTRANEQRQAVTLYDNLGKPSKVKRQIAFKTLWQVWTKVAETPEEYTAKTGTPLPVESQAVEQATPNGSKPKGKKAPAKKAPVAKKPAAKKAPAKAASPAKAERAKSLPINDDLVRKIVGEVFNTMSQSLRADMADFVASVGAGPDASTGKVRVLGLVLDPQTFQALQEISKQWNKPPAEVVTGLIRGLVSTRANAA